MLRTASALKRIGVRWAPQNAQGTNTALKAMATALGKGVEKKLMRAALTKGTICPLNHAVTR